MGETSSAYEEIAFLLHSVCNAVLTDMEPLSVFLSVMWKILGEKSKSLLKMAFLHFMDMRHLRQYIDSTPWLYKLYLSVISLFFLYKNTTVSHETTARIDLSENVMCCSIQKTLQSSYLSLLHYCNGDFDAHLLEITVAVRPWKEKEFLQFYFSGIIP